MRLSLILAAALLAGPAVAATPETDPAAIPVEQGIASQTLVTGLEHPWGMAFLPSGDILVTERPGRLRLVRDGKLLPEPVTGVPEVFAQGQGGLLDVALAPDFAKSGVLFLSYAHGTPEANATRVARARLDGAKLSDLKVIFEVTPAKSGRAHFGSRLLPLEDGTLLVSVGDGGNPPTRLGEAFIRDQAQNLGSPIGKMVRIRADVGGPPQGNPFVGRDGADPVIWSYGHRNIQGLARDPATGALFATEHGAQGGDELNRLKPGANYGWPIVTHAVEYGPERRPITADRARDGTEQPLAVWTPAVAPSGLAVYRGAVFPQWNGDLLAGALIWRERSNPGAVIRLDLDEAGQVRGQTQIQIGARVRDVRVGPDGAIYVLTDETAGRLIRLTPSR